MKIPAQYLPIMPYLILNNARAFADFARAVFGATEQTVIPADDGSIRHGELKMHEAVIMFSEASEAWPEKTAALYVYVEDVDRVYQLARDHGAQNLQAPGPQDYGYTAGFADPYGNHWFVVAGEKE